MSRMQEKIQELLAQLQWRGRDEAEQVAFEQWLDSPEGRGWLEYGEAEQRATAQSIPA